VRNAALMRSAALKSTIFVGVPRVCRIAYPLFSVVLSISFLLFSRIGHRSSRRTHGRARRRREGWPADRLTQVRRPFHLLKSSSPRQQASGWYPPSCPCLSSPSRTANPENIEAIIARGTALWNSIYEPHAVKLHDKLASYHPDLVCMSPLPPFLN
jgi:hypothetical protein